MRIAAILVMFVLVFTSCKKSNPETFPLEPIISFKSISPLLVRVNQDTIRIVFDFTDGDGNLGRDRTDTAIDVFIIDVRGGLRTPFNYRLPNITPIGTVKAISGEVEISIESPFKRPGVLVDSVLYEIQIRDRANNYSNIISTPTIGIRD